MLAGKYPQSTGTRLSAPLMTWLAKGAIVPVTQPTEWVSLLKYPHKADGSLHICLDPKDLNKAIVQEHYKAPNLEEISHHLNGATCFSKLDAKDGFWSIHLDEKSSYLATFNTHRGRSRFLHVFQPQDTCVYGHTPEEHDWHLLELMQTAAQHGIVFNSSKCQMRQPQITFYGAVSTTKACSQIPPRSNPYKTSLQLNLH